jgi:hypothetical protein
MIVNIRVTTADLCAGLDEGGRCRCCDADAPTLRALEQSAVAAIQSLTGRYLGVVASVTDILRFKSWPLALNNDPIGGVLTSLDQWNGTAWQAETLTNYFVDGSFVWPNTTFTWPLTPLVPYGSRRFRAIYQAGYTVSPTDSDVWDAPADIQQAVKLLVGHWLKTEKAW